MEVRALKLTSGEEVLGKVVSETDTEVVLDAVLGLMAQQGAKGMQIGLVPFMMSNPDSDKITFERTNIVCSTKPTKQLEDGYLQQTSGIDLSTKLK